MNGSLLIGVAGACLLVAIAYLSKRRGMLERTDREQWRLRIAGDLRGYREVVRAATTPESEVAFEVAQLQQRAAEVRHRLTREMSPQRMKLGKRWCERVDQCLDLGSQVIHAERAAPVEKLDQFERVCRTVI